MVSNDSSAKKWWLAMSDLFGDMYKTPENPKFQPLKNETHGAYMHRALLSKDPSEIHLPIYFMGR